MKRFQDKVAIITGAGRGLGAQYAQDLAREGAIVAIWDIHAANLEKVRQNIEAEGGRAIPSTTDITDPAQIERTVSEIVHQFGKVDILINNAAFHKSQPVVETSLEDWKMQIDTNLNGTFYCIKAVLPHMLRKTVWKNIEYCLCSSQSLLPGLCSVRGFKSRDCQSFECAFRRSQI